MNAMPFPETVKAFLRLWAIGEGAEVCDKCNEIIWPEIELVRCDFCVGKHGPPDVKLVLEAQKRCKNRIMAYESEMREGDYPDEEDDPGREADRETDPSYDGGHLPLSQGGNELPGVDQPS